MGDRWARYMPLLVLAFTWFVWSIKPDPAVPLPWLMW